MSVPPVFLSLVIPVYNEEAALPALFPRLKALLDGALAGFSPVEVVLVNDGSADASWGLIEAECRADARFVGVDLSRNFGHQMAMTAGLHQARGEVVVTLDADLQDPPELVVEMIAKYRDGYDVVQATRRSRGSEGLVKRVTAAGFYWIMEHVAGVRVPRNTGDFRLLSRRALQALARLPESHRFLRGLVPWIGFPQTQVYYDRADRVAGETHYPLHKMLLLAFDGITSMSTAPLKLAYLMSLGMFFVVVAYLSYTLYKYFILHVPWIPGWPSLMAAIAIFGTIQLLMLGILGEYMGRVYEQVKQRPLYLVRDVVRKD
jgi:dolichol-phosphate mannosyltransferase